MIIQKEDLATAIRLFITLILFREKEKDKDKKIKFNKRNIIDYLSNKDLWKSSLYNNKIKFEENLLKLKALNIKIEEILFFYYYLINNQDEGFEEEIKKNINSKVKEIRVDDPGEEKENSLSEELDDSDDESEKRRKRRKRRKRKENI